MLKKIGISLTVATVALALVSCEASTGATTESTAVASQVAAEEADIEAWSHPAGAWLISMTQSRFSTRTRYGLYNFTPETGEITLLADLGSSEDRDSTASFLSVSGDYRYAIWDIRPTEGTSVNILDFGDSSQRAYPIDLTEIPTFKPDTTVVDVSFLPDTPHLLRVVTHNVDSDSIELWGFDAAESNSKPESLGTVIASVGDVFIDKTTGEVTTERPSYSQYVTSDDGPSGSIDSSPYEFPWGTDIGTSDHAMFQDKAGKQWEFTTDSSDLKQELFISQRDSETEAFSSYGKLASDMKYNSIEWVRPPQKAYKQ
jgi:hypothetical protein